MQKWRSRTPLQLAIFGLITYLSGQTSQATYRTDFLQETCACSDSELPENSCDPFTLPPVPEGAGHVALSREPEFYRQFFCQFIIEAPPHKTLQLFINNISIPETLKCKAGILRVYDGIPAAGGWELTHVCGRNVKDRLIRSSTNVMTLYYYQGADILWDPKTFNVTYTYVHEHKPKEEKPCNTTFEYQCANLLCINRRLKCDGYDNCGDRSEELMDVHVCGSRYDKTDPVVGVSVGAVVGVIVAINLLIAFAYWVRRRAGPFFTDTQLRRNAQNAVDAANMEGHPDGSRSEQRADLLAPDLTRDLVDGRHTGSSQNEAANGNVSQSDVSSVDFNQAPKDLPPPSYSSLFPDLV